MHFEPYPFEKLTELLKDITPNSDYPAVSLTIGEPQFETPDFIQEAFKKIAPYSINIQNLQVKRM